MWFTRLSMELMCKVKHMDPSLHENSKEWWLLFPTLFFSTAFSPFSFACELCCASLSQPISHLLVLGILATCYSQLSPNSCWSSHQTWYENLRILQIRNLNVEPWYQILEPQINLTTIQKEGLDFELAVDLRPRDKKN